MNSEQYQDLWSGQWWIHFQRGTLSSAEDDGWKQSEGRSATADRGQDDLDVRQGWWDQEWSTFIIILKFQENKNKINFDEFCDVVGNMDIHKKMVLQVWEKFLVFDKFYFISW